MAALSSARAVLRVLARTSSSCPRRAWTESNSVWRACTFSELQGKKKIKKQHFIKKQVLPVSVVETERKDFKDQGAASIPAILVHQILVQSLLWPQGVIQSTVLRQQLLQLTLKCIKRQGQLPKPKISLAEFKNCSSDDTKPTWWSGLPFESPPSDCSWARDNRKADSSFCRRWHKE